MELSVNQAVSQALQAKTGVTNANIAVAIAGKQLDTQEIIGNAVAEMLNSANASMGRGQVVNRVV